MKLSNLECGYFSSIKIDHFTIFFGEKGKIPKDPMQTIYNQVKGYFAGKNQVQKSSKFDYWIATTFSSHDALRVLDDHELFLAAVKAWEESLQVGMKPNFFAELVKVKRRSSTKLEFYAVVEEGVLEKICESGPRMYTELKTYCEFWEKANQFCYEHKLEDPSEMNAAAIRRMLKESLDNKLIEQVDNIRTLGNDREDWSLAYYDLDCGSVTNPTPAWDNFLSQMEHDDVRNCFRAWVYSVFKADNFGRQLLWLYGTGETGKSVVANVIYNRLMKINATIVTSLESKDNMDKFSMATYLSKRLVLGADYTDRAIVRHQLVKNITGKDVVNSREMNKAKEAYEVYAKILITSNAKPFLDVNKTEEISRVILICLITDLCTKAKKNWFESGIGDWKECLENEMDDFIAQSKAAYYWFLKEDGHNFRDYEGFKNVADETLYYIRRDVPVWWKHCVKKTEDPKHLLRLTDMTDDYERFLRSEVKMTPRTKRLVRSFCTTHLSEQGINVYDLGNFGVLYIEGYKLVNRKLTATNVINHMIQSKKNPNAALKGTGDDDVNEE